MASADVVNESIETKELRCEKFGKTKAPTVPQTGWSTTNGSTDRDIDVDVAAEVGDGLHTLINDLISKGIISA